MRQYSCNAAVNIIIKTKQNPFQNGKQDLAENDAATRAPGFAPHNSSDKPTAVSTTTAIGKYAIFPK